MAKKTTTRAAKKTAKKAKSKSAKPKVIKSKTIAQRMKVSKAPAIAPAPMITCVDVEKSAAWYSTVLGAKSGHGGKEYDMIVANDALVLQLHAWDTHEHSNMGDPNKLKGNGVMLWFHSQDFDFHVEALSKVNANLVEEPHYNELSYSREVWFRDLDGYLVVISGK